MTSSARPLLPGLVIAGVPKAATSSLWSYLARHPGVAASATKETRYWDGFRFADVEVAPLAAYSEQWEGTDPSALRMEATPGYFYGGRPLAAAIEAQCPDVHVLIVLREPVSRLRSALQHHQSRLSLPQELSLRDYVDTCLTRMGEGRPDTRSNRYLGVEQGRYAAYLPDWIEVFGDRLRIVFFDDVVGRPRAVLSDVCSWLGLDTEVVDDLVLAPRNVSHAYRNARLQRLALRWSGLANKRWLRDTRARAVLVRAYQRVNGRPVKRDVEPDDARVVEEMRHYYAEQNAGLREMSDGRVLGDVPAWVG